MYFILEAGARELPHQEEPVRMHGHHTYATGAEYMGQWLGAHRHGFGGQRWLDGSEYIGNWQRDRATGSGRFQYSDGSTYIGQWSQGRAHGSGIYRNANGNTYEGQFVFDLQNGHGVETWPDASHYSGEFSRGMKNGSVYMCGPMVRALKANGMQVRSTAPSSTLVQMGGISMANGVLQCCMVMAVMGGQMASATEDSMCRTRRMALEYLFWLTSASTRASGLTGTHMAQVASIVKMAQLNMLIGRLVIVFRSGRTSRRNTFLCVCIRRLGHTRQ